ncbi:MAG: oligoendopeptidase F, partial [Pseudomonadota bacterium]
MIFARRGAAFSKDMAASSIDEADMPVWNLDDLYPGMESAELNRDIEVGAAEAKAFEESWKGKLDVALGDDKLGGLIAEFEALQDRLGRIGSYAGLLYASDTSDPVRGKFYGDIQQKLTEVSQRLLFFG